MQRQSDCSVLSPFKRNHVRYIIIGVKLFRVHQSFVYENTVERLLKLIELILGDVISLVTPILKTEHGESFLSVSDCDGDREWQNGKCRSTEVLYDPIAKITAFHTDDEGK